MMTVRLALAGDLEDLFLLNELFENATTKEIMEKTLRENDREIVCIGFIDGVAAGFCTGLVEQSMCYAAQRVDIETLYVRGEYRKRGLGDALLRHLENEAVSRGIRHFHLTTGANNLAAQSLYKRNHYVDSGEVLLEKTVAR